MTNSNIVSIVLNVPKLSIKNPGGWWPFWEANAAFIKKTKSNHNEAANTINSWRGFDVYRSTTYDPTSAIYAAPLVDCSSVFPEIYSFINLLPVHHLGVRIAQSLRNFLPHSDSSTPMVSVRTLLHDDNPNPSFYYFHNNKKIYQTLPAESNTWAYKDSEIQHGSDFQPGYRKLLVMYFGVVDESVSDTWFQNTTFNSHSVII